MLEKYEKYIKILNKQLEEYFNLHKKFIVCKSGCSICCKNSYFAVSELEYSYVKNGFEKLNSKQREIITQKAIEIFKERRQFLKTNQNIFDFSYQCPFLNHDTCSIYEYRPMLCRSHGLIYKDIEKQNKINLPYCVNLGLNYANIWDNKTNYFSKEKLLNLGSSGIPESFDLSYSSLMKKAKDIEFGDVRMIIEWIILDLPNYEEVIKF